MSCNLSWSWALTRRIQLRLTAAASMRRQQKKKKKKKRRLQLHRRSQLTVLEARRLPRPERD
jgi:hypothetical protein